MPPANVDLEYEIVSEAAALAPLDGCAYDLLEQCRRERAGVPHGQKRRKQLIVVLERAEQRTRKLIRKMPEPQAAAVWDATWQLRLDVIAACERCAAAEHAAKWARDE